MDNFYCGSCALPTILTPRKAINKAFLKIRPVRSEIELFKSEFKKLLNSIEHNESEEHHKNSLSDFLKNTYYSNKDKYINTNDKIDLVIHNGNSKYSSVGVIIEAKRPTNQNEMPTIDDLNKKALQELVLYFLRERIVKNNLEIKHLIVTNVKEWFIFDGALFDKHFAQDNKFEQKFKDFESGKLSITTTDQFYEQIAKPKINEIVEKLEFVHFTLKDYEKVLNDNDNYNDNKLIPIFKLLSPEHLLKLPFQNDSNTLDNRFYSELLYIIGLVESRSGSKKLIGRNEANKRISGTLIENAINVLDDMDKLPRIKNIESYGSEKEERLYNVALELVITWVNRVLFLKLLESQLISYHKGDENYSFLNYKNIACYDDLNQLFFSVLAKRHEERHPEIKEKYANIPYLNSSLFEPSDLEQVAFAISGLNTNKNIPVFSNTVLKNENGKKLTGELNSLKYLFKFLDAYDFTSEGSEDIQEENKTLINASVLGLIFEKINGYKDGSYFTPGFITMYMCREAISKAVIQKFNDVKGWDCQNLKEIYNKIHDISEANNIINEIKICDPAVGSGHFLVSSLNEIIAIKSELKILQDLDGKRLKEYQIEVENDELAITDENGSLFKYNPKNSESQRVQKTLFHEKQTIIENCLFGVDINPNSVKICRLRLWIELLKNAYYKNEQELETLPNIDINIKCGNSLISKFAIDADLKQTLKKNDLTIESYKNAVNGYKNAKDKVQKRDMEALIETIKSNFSQGISASNPKYIELAQLKEYKQQLTAVQLFEKSKKEIAEDKKKLAKIEPKITKLEAAIEDLKTNKIYKNSFEWRFEFPEVLDEEGNFIGFDVIIGNPPYIKEPENRSAFSGLYTSPYYQGKMDLWYFFGAFGLDVLKQNGTQCYIAPNNWVTNSGASKLRNKIITDSRIIKFIDFGNFMVFDTAAIQTMIYLIEKNSHKDEYSFEYKRNNLVYLEDYQLINFLTSRVESKDFDYFDVKINRVNNMTGTLNFVRQDIAKILDKMQLQDDVRFLTDIEVAQGIVMPQDFLSKQHLKDYPNYTIGEGIFNLSQEEFDTVKWLPQELAHIKPFYTSKELKQYSGAHENSLWILYMGSDAICEIDNYPNIKAHLDKFEKVITSDNKPYGLHRARNEKFFKGEKIVSLRKCLNPTFTYTDFECYVSQTYFVIKSSRFDMKYLTGILNSKAIKFWLRQKGKMQGDHFQIDKEPILNIPIPTTSQNTMNHIETLTKELIKSKKIDADADISEIENKLNIEVYKLYGLTEDEISIVELNT